MADHSEGLDLSKEQAVIAVCSTQVTLFCCHPIVMCGNTYNKSSDTGVQAVGACFVKADHQTHDSRRVMVLRQLKHAISVIGWVVKLHQRCQRLSLQCVLSVTSEPHPTCMCRNFLLRKHSKVGLK